MKELIPCDLLVFFIQSSFYEHSLSFKLSIHESVCMFRLNSC